MHHMEINALSCILMYAFWNDVWLCAVFTSIKMFDTKYCGSRLHFKEIVGVYSKGAHLGCFHCLQDHRVWIIIRTLKWMYCIPSEITGHKFFILGTKLLLRLQFVTNTSWALTIFITLIIAIYPVLQIHLIISLILHYLLLGTYYSYRLCIIFLAKQRLFGLLFLHLQLPRFFDMRKLHMGSQTLLSGKTRPKYSSQHDPEPPAFGIIS